MQRQMSESKKTVLKFPVPRVKKIIQENQEIGKINNVVPHLTTKSLELFLSDILEETVRYSKQTNQNKITPQILKAVVMNSKYDFIKDAVEHISDPEDAQQKQKAGRKKKTQGTPPVPKIDKKSKPIKKKGKQNTKDVEISVSDDESYNEESS